MLAAIFDINWGTVFLDIFIIIAIYIIYRVVKPNPPAHVKPLIPPQHIQPVTSGESIYLDGVIDTSDSVIEVNFQESAKTKGCYLIFDTETTGLPADRNAPSNDIVNWPRVVSISWILFDDEGRFISNNSYILNQTSPIPEDSIQIHGITDEVAFDEGTEAEEVFSEFASALENCQYVVAHNTDFDASVVESEFYRLGKRIRISKAERLCTMKAGAKLYNELYGKKRWLKLEDLFEVLFGRDVSEQVHDAEFDALCVAACFFQLKKEGYINPIQSITE